MHLDTVLVRYQIVVLRRRKLIHINWTEEAVTLVDPNRTMTTKKDIVLVTNS